MNNNYLYFDTSLSFKTYSSDHSRYLDFCRNLQMTIQANQGNTKRERNEKEQKVGYVFNHQINQWDLAYYANQRGMPLEDFTRDYIRWRANQIHATMQRVDNNFFVDRKNGNLIVYKVFSNEF